MHSDLEGSIMLQETFDLLSHKQVTELFGKTPKAMKMRSVRLCNEQGEMEVLYLKADEARPYKKLVVTSGSRDIVSRYTLTNKKECFASQLVRGLSVMRGASLTKALGGRTLQRPPTLQVLNERASYLKQPKHHKGTKAERAPTYEGTAENGEGGEDEETSDCSDEEDEVTLWDPPPPTRHPP